MRFVVVSQSRQVIARVVVILHPKKMGKRTALNAVKWQVPRIDYDFSTIILHFRSSVWPLAQ